MQADKLEILNDAFSKYNELLEKIKAMHVKSEEYLIPSRPELDELLYNANSYMGNVFNCIANATGDVTEAEKAFIDKLDIYKSEEKEADSGAIMASTFDSVPKYIELASALDRLGETNYAKELIDDTLAILKKLMDIDGNTYADESSFTYSFIDMLEKYVKSNRKREL